MLRRAVLVMILGSILLTSPAESQRPAARIETGLVQSTTPVRVIARFHEEVPEAVRDLEGFEVSYRFASLPAVYGVATPRAITWLADHRDLRALEADKPIDYDLDTATVASGARAVWAPDPPAEPIRDDRGAIVDGNGIGVAVVDTGLDGLHPDFEGRVGGNWIVTPAGLVPTPYSVLGAGHGTHVAGIAAGSGAFSAGKFAGAAPGATLYGFGMGNGSTFFAAAAFDWIIANGAGQQPPIRVVNNSWHCRWSGTCASLDPELIHIQLATLLAERGIVVTWAAGNGRGDGFMPTTNFEARNPTPGIISVANYSDGDGARNRCVSFGSSRGAALDPATWPDVSAPGSDVTSTWAATADTGDPAAGQRPRTPAAGPYPGANYYRALSGTSMAAPHVAGIAALMLQARPTLTPGEIEYLLKATASKLSCGVAYASADASHPFDGANYVDGHGLVDARAAVDAARTFTGIPAPAPVVESLPDAFGRTRLGIDPARSLYLVAGGSLSDTAPSGDVPQARAYQALQDVTWTSQPLTAFSAERAQTNLWMGVAWEGPVLQVVLARIFVIVSRVEPDGTKTRIGERTMLTRFTWTAAPVHRRWDIPLPVPTSFADGDRVELLVRVASASSTAPGLEVPFVVYTDSERTPSHLLLGTGVVGISPYGQAACALRHDCSEVGEAAEISTFYCGSSVPIRVVWWGPPGSSITGTCDAAIATCTVAGAPGDPWGGCEAVSRLAGPQSAWRSACTFRTPDGAREGIGRCESLLALTSDADQ